MFKMMGELLFVLLLMIPVPLIAVAAQPQVPSAPTPPVPPGKIVAEEPDAWFLKEQQEATKTPEELAKEKDEKEKIETEKRERFDRLAKIEGLAFQHIPFGASRSDVSIELKSKFSEYIWTSELLPDHYSDVLYRFPVGDLSLDVLFIFDHEDALYKLLFRTMFYTASEFDPQVLEASTQLTEIFKNKFGTPTKCFKPHFLSIREGYVSYACKWQNKKIDIYTGLATGDFKYYAMGVISSKKRERAFERYKKQKAKTKAVEGANSF